MIFRRRRLSGAWLFVGSVVLLLLAPASRAVTRFSVQTWNSSSGLPQDTVRQFLQTRDGYLWLATEGGLVRFDANDFTVYDKRTTAGFSSDLINQLFEDAQGRLWISTAAGLFLRTATGFRRYGLQEGLPSESVWATSEDALGRVWAATSAGAAVISGERFQPAHSGQLDGRLAAPFAKASDGTLWLVSASSITRVDPLGRFTSFPLSSAPRQLAVGPDSALWLVTADGLLRCDGHTVTPVATPAPPTSLAWSPKRELWLGTDTGVYQSATPSDKTRWHHIGVQEGLPSEQVIGLFPARRTGEHKAADELVVSTSVGLAVYRDGTFVALFAQDGFRGSDLLTAYQDREGDLWLGTEAGGAAVLRPSLFTTVTSRDGLPTDQVRSVLDGSSRSAAETASDLWLGTAAGLTHLEGKAMTTVTVTQGLPSNQILTLAPGAAPGSLWVGTPDGLTYLHQGRAVTLTASDGLPDDTIRSLLLARDQTLWIGTRHGLASLPAGDPSRASGLRTWTEKDGLGSNTIGALLEDADGSLWIGTLHGLSHLAGGHIQTYAEKDGLTTPVVTALFQDKEGTLWIGTSGGGLSSRHNGLITHMGHPTAESSGTRSDTTPVDTGGRLPSVVYSIVEDATAHLWLGSSTGVYRLAIRESIADPASLATQRFDVTDGLRLQDCASGGHPEAALSPEGLLWFATQKGASFIDTREEALDRPAPPIRIENVTVDDTAVDAEDTLHFGAEHARIAFHYAGLSFSTPSKVRYRYQLDHFDRSWIDAGTRRTAYYTNIPPGRYTFRVLASTDGGNWSETAASTDFTIAPHYYQTWWFFTLLAALLALLVWQLYLYRLRQVELRFDAVLAERGRIAREIHDTLAQDIVGISVQLELVSRLMTISVEKAREQLLETRALVRRSLAEARSSIWDLRSSGSGDLPSRLRSSAKELTTDKPVTLALDIAGTYRAFPRTVEDELLRIAQEAITNAVRHASARTIRVSLHYHAAGVRLEVEDDGCGFVPAADRSGPAGHYGIRGMHERAERAQGTLTIQSTPGTGTTVIAEAPQEAAR